MSSANLLTSLHTPRCWWFLNKLKSTRPSTVSPWHFSLDISLWWGTLTKATLDLLTGNVWEWSSACKTDVQPMIVHHRYSDPNSLSKACQVGRFVFTLNFGVLGEKSMNSIQANILLNSPPWLSFLKISYIFWLPLFTPWECFLLSPMPCKGYDTFLSHPPRMNKVPFPCWRNTRFWNRP